MGRGKGSEKRLSTGDGEYAAVYHVKTDAIGKICMQARPARYTRGFHLAVRPEDRHLLQRVCKNVQATIIQILAFISEQLSTLPGNKRAITGMIWAGNRTKSNHSHVSPDRMHEGRFRSAEQAKTGAAKQTHTNTRTRNIPSD